MKGRCRNGNGTVQPHTKIETRKTLAIRYDMSTPGAFNYSCVFVGVGVLGFNDIQHRVRLMTPTK